MSTIGTARNACADPGAFHYQRHRSEKTLLYQLVSKHYPDFRRKLAEEGRALPGYVQGEFEDYLKCGRLEHGFLRVRCETCHEERLVVFSCKRRGFCSSCGARRMAESSALLVDEVFPHQPVRQWGNELACAGQLPETGHQHPRYQTVDRSDPGLGHFDFGKVSPAG